MPASVRLQPATDELDFVVTDRPRPTTDRPTLTLDELEAHDPHATARGTAAIGDHKLHIGRRLGSDGRGH